MDPEAHTVALLGSRGGPTTGQNRWEQLNHFTGDGAPEYGMVQQAGDRTGAGERVPRPEAVLPRVSLRPLWYVMMTWRRNLWCLMKFRQC